MILFLVIVLGMAVMLICMAAPDWGSKSKSTSRRASVPFSQQAVIKSSNSSTCTQLQQAKSTGRTLSGSNEDLAYIFGSMVAALGATGYIQICGNGIVSFRAGNFGSNWDLHKIDLPQNVYQFISNSNILTDKVVAGTRVMKYEPQGQASCSLSPPAKWAEDVNLNFDIFKRELEQGYVDTSDHKGTLLFRTEITPEAQYAVLWVTKDTKENAAPIPSSQKIPIDRCDKNSTVDQSIIDKVLFLESVTIDLARSKRVNGNNIYHGYIRCTADDFNGRSYVSFYGSVFNVLSEPQQCSAFSELLSNITLSNCTKYLDTIGSTNVSPKRFSEFVSNTTITQSPSSAGEGFTAKYSVNVSNGMGCVYHDILLQNLKQTYPYYNFDCEYGEIDLSI